jgi:hypothetical protein
MPCTEFVNAIDWSKKTTNTEHFPVIAYFTKHFGTTGPATLPGAKDAVHYASGKVFAVDTPKPHLKGTLKAAKNSEQDGEMVETSTLTYDVEIFPDGTLSYLMKLNGQPVGGMPPTKVQATCVNNVLLTATSGSEVVTVGVARKPSVFTPA